MEIDPTPPRQMIYIRVSDGKSVRVTVVRMCDTKALVVDNAGHVMWCDRTYLTPEN